MIVFPAQNQTKEQQLGDEQACYAWAIQNTGIDPAKVKANPDSAAKAAGAKMDSAATGAAVAGAARGAAGGAVVGAITGDAGEGAAVGAVVGAVGGGARRNRPCVRPKPREPRRPSSKPNSSSTPTRRRWAPALKERATRSASG
jgi:hypothetical protein